MLSLTRKADYALVAMADLARQSPTTVSARDMAARLQMPLPALQQILTRSRQMRSNVRRWSWGLVGLLHRDSIGTDRGG